MIRKSPPAGGLLAVDSTQVATQITQAWPRRLGLQDRTPCYRPDEFLSQGITGGHSSRAQAPSRLGTGHAFSRTQDGCLLARSAAAQSCTSRQVSQASRLDAPRSPASRPGSTTSNLPHFSASGMANGRTRNHASGRGRQGESDQHRRCR
jgi:hypothetical protein